MNESLDLTVNRGSHVNRNPAISIITPNYNTAAYIAETLDSVFAQTFTDYELIVINDASPDSNKLATVLEPYRDRIIFIDKSKNEGTSATRNLAVKRARAQVISFLDADDIWFPTYLEDLYGFLNTTGFDLVYADAETFFDGSVKKAYDFLPYNPDQGEVTRRMLIDGRCHILPSGTLIRKSAFLDVGGFDPGVARTEDFDLWMRMLFAGKRFGYLRKILFKFRISPGSGSGDSVVRLERTRDIWHVLQRKLTFTDDENAIIAGHIAAADAGALRAKGRVYINERNWSRAKAVFSEASSKADELGLPITHRLKMKAIIVMLYIAPEVVRLWMRKLRADEIEYMPATDDPK